MADGGRRVELHRLDPDTLRVVESRTATVDPYDAEDLAAGPDGSLWVGDIGDNDQRRDTVAVIVVPRHGRPQVRTGSPIRTARTTRRPCSSTPTGCRQWSPRRVGAAGIYQPEGPRG